MPSAPHTSYAVKFAHCSKRILAEVTNGLFELDEISGADIFIDGTKIETNANKYTLDYHVIALLSRLRQKFFRQIL